MLPLIAVDNMFTRTHFNYSLETKAFSEKMITFWTNFVKYDDPNGLNRPNMNESKVYWDTFKNKKTGSENNYLFLKNEGISMASGYSEHNCDLWNR
jgi:hypothetical protein